MNVLSWDKPKKARSAAEHAATYSADGAPPGVYVPNMSDADAQRWRAKLIGGENPRVEIRKTLDGTQIKIVVTKEGRRNESVVTMSMNGPALFDETAWIELQWAIVEAGNALEDAADLLAPPPVIGLHGDCVGWDAEFDTLCVQLG